MSDHHRSQLYERLNAKETDELLDIWHHRDITEWQEIVFDIVGEILTERLGKEPPEPAVLQVAQILEQVERDIAQRAWERALEGCERAIAVMPDCALAYHHRGRIFQATDRLDEAAASYISAIQLDPGLKAARQNLRQVESDLENAQSALPPITETKTQPSAEEDSRLEEEYEASPAKKLLDEAFEFADNGHAEKALEACESAKATLPEYAGAYEDLGLVYSMLDRFGPAHAAYSKALRLGSDQIGIWKDFREVEEELRKEFEGSSEKRHLDQALEYAEGEETDLALQEIETAKASLPEIAPAYNYLGLILQALRQYEPAVEAYLQAIHYNPRYSPARQNLRSAKIAWEAEQYRRAAITNLEEDEGPLPELDDPEILKVAEYIGTTPGWLYLDETAHWLRGWPGFRNRPGRIGLDPLDAYFEEPHTYGILIRRLLNRRFRSHNVVYLLLMTFAGLIYSSPVFMLLLFIEGGWFFPVISLILYSPLFIVGFALLLNVFLSLVTRPPEDHPSPFY